MGALKDVLTIADRTFKTGRDIHASTRSSLAKLSKPARVEPLCVIDSDCIQLEYISDVVQCLQSIFTGYYLQAVSLLGTVSGVSVLGDLDRLNPHREFSIPDVVEDVLKKAKLTYASDSFYLSEENYKWSLPMIGDRLALEANNRNRDQRGRPNSPDKLKNRNKEKRNYLDWTDDKWNSEDQWNVSHSDKEGKVRKIEIDEHIEKMANLSIGKVLQVTIEREGKSVTVPVTVRLLVNELPGNIIVKMFGKDPMETSFVERYYKWKAGRISFFSDLILCRDLVKARKKELMQDENKVVSEIARRANDNLASAIYSKKPSLATASNLYIMSTDTVTAIKRVSGLDLSKYNHREEIFGKTYAMILCVIDRDYERVTFYHDGIAMPTTLGVRDLRHINKDSGPTINDVLSAYKQGQAPVL